MKIARFPDKLSAVPFDSERHVQYTAILLAWLCVNSVIGLADSTALWAHVSLLTVLASICMLTTAAVLGQ